MALKLIKSPRYQALRDNLPLGARAAVRIVENEIVRDPSPGPNRRVLDDGSIVDFSAEDLLVQYRLLRGGVLLELVLDERVG
jgi:hypothetical protein